MILRRLRLTNFRQYHDQTLLFQDGITGIVGPNGAGKSTLLEAVLWCLFGNRAARTSKEGIRRQATSSAEPCAVELEFDLNDISYRLTRTLSGRTNRADATLIRLGKLEAVTIRGVDEYIVKLIGLDLKGFLSSFFARQKELNALSDARPAERKDHLAGMLGVGRLDGAIELLKEDIKTTRVKIETLGSLQIDPVLIGEELAGKEAERAGMAKRQAVLQAGLTTADQEAGERQKSVEQLQKVQHEHNRLERLRSTLTARRQGEEKTIERLTAEIAEIDASAMHLNELKAAADQVEAARTEVGRLRQAELLGREKGRLEKERETLSRLLAERTAQMTKDRERAMALAAKLTARQDVDNAFQEAEAARETLRNEYRELNTERKMIEQDLARLRRQKGEIEQLGPDAVCQSCLRPIGQDFAGIERHFEQEILSLSKRAEPMDRRLADIEKEGISLAGRIDIAKKEIEILVRAEHDLALVRAAVNAAEAYINEGESRRGELDKRLAEIGKVEFDPAALATAEEKVRALENQKEAYFRLAERAARRPQLGVELTLAKATIDDIERELIETAAHQKGLGFDEQKLQDAQRDLAATRDRAAGLRLEIERLEGDMRLLDSEIHTRRRRLEEYEKSRVEIARLRDLLTCLEKVSLLFGEFRKYLIGRIRPILSRHTSQLFHEMTGGRYQDVELDEDYNLRLSDRGELFPAERFSGGEVDLLNLCFRLAISVEMAASANIEQSFIILDEIFGSQDSRRRQLIVEGLHRLKNRFRQIVIISHIEEVKEMAEHILEVEVDPAGISRVIVSEAV